MSLLLTWYGDDFTGSGAVMETLEKGGIPSVLFLQVPDAALLARFSGRRAVGVAGDARSRDPAWMAAHLPGIFAALRGLGAPLLHYKLCSTFDSAPHVGSIGKATELGLTGPDDWAPMVVAAPQIGRWQAFGNLFASAPDGVARLDRHPTMAQHPVTPMHEADVRRHLALQTDLPIGLVDVLALQAGRADAALAEARAAGARIVAFDVLDAQTLAEAGRVIWQAAMARPLFALGSQGLEDALIAHWNAGKAAPPALPPVGGAGRIAVVSGSCSPDTARQIAAAEGAGFAPIRLEAALVADEGAFAAACHAAGDAALAALGRGQSPLVFTAMGPDDPSLAAVAEVRARAGLTAVQATARLSRGLGGILRRLVGQAGLTRAVIAGGDTSSHATAELRVVALTVAGSVAPSVPLMLAHGADAGRPPLELVLKGGQMGRADLFATIRDGVQAQP